MTLAVTMPERLIHLAPIDRQPDSPQTGGTPTASLGGQSINGAGLVRSSITPRARRTSATIRPTAKARLTRAIVVHDRSSKHFDQPLFASRFNSFGSRGGVSSWDDGLHLKQASPTGPMPERVRSQELAGLLSPTPQFERAWSASLCRAREYRYARWRFVYSR